MKSLSCGEHTSDSDASCVPNEEAAAASYLNAAFKLERDANCITVRPASVKCDANATGAGCH